MAVSRRKHLMGGIVAVIIYELLVIVPMSSFYLLLMFLVGLLFGKKIFLHAARPVVRFCF